VLLPPVCGVLGFFECFFVVVEEEVRKIGREDYGDGLRGAPWDL